MAEKLNDERRDPMGRGARRIDRELVLPTSFYSRGAVEVARDLLGRFLVSTVGGERIVSRIVETEAYFGPDDDASHASSRIGRTTRNEAMFGVPGIAYVYRIYGIHWCLNAVTDRVGHPAAVLIRAAEILEGAEVASARRPGRNHVELLRGPGNLCAGLGITGELNLHPLQEAPLAILGGEPVPSAEVLTGPRVGITRAADLPLRFRVRGSAHVSKAR